MHLYVPQRCRPQRLKLEASLQSRFQQSASCVACPLKRFKQFKPFGPVRLNPLYNLNRVNGLLCSISGVQMLRNPGSDCFQVFKRLNFKRVWLRCLVRRLRGWLASKSCHCGGHAWSTAKSMRAVMPHTLRDTCEAQSVLARSLGASGARKSQRGLLSIHLTIPKPARRNPRCKQHGRERG